MNSRKIAVTAVALATLAAGAALAQDKGACTTMKTPTGMGMLTAAKM